MSTEITNELLGNATQFLQNTGKATISALRREFSLDFAKSCELMAALEEEGVVTEPSMNKSREVVGFEYY